MFFCFCLMMMMMMRGGGGGGEEGAARGARSVACVRERETERGEQGFGRDAQHSPHGRAPTRARPPPQTRTHAPTHAPPPKHTQTPTHTPAHTHLVRLEAVQRAVLEAERDDALAAAVGAHHQVERKVLDCTKGGSSSGSSVWWCGWACVSVCGVCVPGVMCCVL